MHFVVVMGLLSAISARVEAQSATIVMTASTTTVALGDTLNVQIRADSNGGDIDDLDVPDFDGFRIVARSESRPMQFRFGIGRQTQVVQATTILDFRLEARREGRFSIDPVRVRVGGRLFSSNPLTIVVGSAGSTDPDEGDDPAAPARGLDGAKYDSTAFLRTTVDRSEARVGEQVTVTVYLYVNGSLRDQPVVRREPGTDGFWVHDLLSPNAPREASQQVVNGESFRVYVLRRFAAFPLHSGDLSFGPMQVVVDVGSPFDLFATSGAEERSGVAVPLRVLDLPSDGRPAGPIAVGEYVISASLDRAEARTGDAVTLTVRVEGTGNVRDVVLVVPPIDGVRALAPQSHVDLTSLQDIVQGTKTFTWLLVPERPGHFAISPITLSTFVPATGQYRSLATASASLSVTGTPLPAGVSDPEPAVGVPSDRGSEVPQFGPIRTRSELSRPLRSISEHGAYPWLLGVPPLLFAVLSFGGWIRRSLERRREANQPAQAVRTANKWLKGAHSHALTGDSRGFYAAVAMALLRVLEARIGEPVGGITHGALLEQLVSRGMDQSLARRIIDELDGADFARFGAVAGDRLEMAIALRRASELMVQIERFEPRAEAVA